MKKKFFVFSMAIMMLAASATAYAASGTKSFVAKYGSYEVQGALFPVNPPWTNPYAEAQTMLSAPLFYVKSTVQVINSDGTTQSSSGEESNSDRAFSGNISANTYSSSGVKFKGYHYVSDSNVGGTFNRTTDYTY